jgi:hypothetical protein
MKPPKRRINHGSRYHVLARKALANGRTTTLDVAKAAQPGVWPLDKQHYRYARWALADYAKPIGRPRKGYGRATIWQALP